MKFFCNRVKAISSFSQKEKSRVQSWTHKMELAYERAPNETVSVAASG